MTQKNVYYVVKDDVGGESAFDDPEVAIEAAKRTVAEGGDAIALKVEVLWEPKNCRTAIV